MRSILPDHSVFLLFNAELWYFYIFTIATAYMQFQDKIVLYFSLMEVKFRPHWSHVLFKKSSKESDRHDKIGLCQFQTFLLFIAGNKAEVVASILKFVELCLKRHSCRILILADWENLINICLFLQTHIQLATVKWIQVTD